VRFAQRPDRVGDVVNSEIGYDRVKGVFGKGKHLSVPLFETDAGMVGSRQCDHR
jgi:hypothetical protein